MNKLVKNTVNKNARKLVFKVIKPFLPFIIIILGLMFAICTIIDAIFVQEVQSSSTILPEAQAEIKNLCIEKASYLNSCNNFVNGTLTTSLLDMDNKESDKEIQWAHLYSIMVFHNMINREEINKQLLNNVARYFTSTFNYEQITIKKETKTKDKEGNESISVTENKAYILVESDTIMGHYKYNYKEKIIENGNEKTTTKEFVNEELIGTKYEKLRNYLKKVLHIKDEDIEIDMQIIIQAASRILRRK